MAKLTYRVSMKRKDGKAKGTIMSGIAVTIIPLGDGSAKKVVRKYRKRVNNDKPQES